MKTWLRGHSVTVDEVQGAYEAWMKSRAGKKHGDEVTDLFGSSDSGFVLTLEARSCNGNARCRTLHRRRTSHVGQAVESLQVRC